MNEIANHTAFINGQGYLPFPVNSMDTPPKEEGFYLFYFGGASSPYFDVLKLRFDTDGDFYLVDNYSIPPTLWFRLPEIAK